MLETETIAGLSLNVGASPHFLMMTGKAAKPMGEIHVKTLEEIRREKALQRRETQAKAEAEGHGKTEDSSAGARPARAAPSAQPGPAPAEQKSLWSTKLTGALKKEKKAVELNQPCPKLSSVPDVQPTQQSGTRKCPEKSFEERRWEKWQQREQQEKLGKEEAAVKSTAGFFHTEPAGKVAAQFQGREAKTNLMTSAKPSGGKVTFPKKKALKRKAPGSYPSAIAAVELRTALDADMMGPPAKKAAMVRPGANAEMDPLLNSYPPLGEKVEKANVLQAFCFLGNPVAVYRMLVEPFCIYELNGTL
ncbi:zinc finger CCCH domain-containing protein 11A-like [Anas platyrhynchos]|uniref:zinc finger CCCH domain-containing protein 11A-like n=1 Tax=Anas platyrhynchos TaxID=8839 RepID=UPI003AF25E25